MCHIFCRIFSRIHQNQKSVWNKWTTYHPPLYLPKQLLLLSQIFLYLLFSYSLNHFILYFLKGPLVFEDIFNLTIYDSGCYINIRRRGISMMSSLFVCVIYYLKIFHFKNQNDVNMWYSSGNKLWSKVTNQPFEDILNINFL